MNPLWIAGLVIAALVLYGRRAASASPPIGGTSIAGATAGGEITGGQLVPPASTAFPVDPYTGGPAENILIGPPLRIDGGGGGARIQLL